MGRMLLRNGLLALLLLAGGGLQGCFIESFLFAAHDISTLDSRQDAGTLMIQGTVMAPAGLPASFDPATAPGLPGVSFQVSDLRLVAGMLAGARVQLVDPLSGKVLGWAITGLDGSFQLSGKVKATGGYVLEAPLVGTTGQSVGYLAAPLAVDYSQMASSSVSARLSPASTLLVLAANQASGGGSGLELAGGVAGHHAAALFVALQALPPVLVGLAQGELDALPQFAQVPSLTAMDLALADAAGTLAPVVEQLARGPQQATPNLSAPAAQGAALGQLLLELLQQQSAGNTGALSALLAAAQPWLDPDVLDRAARSIDAGGLLPPVTGVSISTDSLALDAPPSAGTPIYPTSGVLQASVAYPDGTTNAKVVWLSSSPGVATIDPTGKVTAVSPGTCQITALPLLAPSEGANCAVAVAADGGATFVIQDTRRR